MIQTLSIWTSSNYTSDGTKKVLEDTYGYDNFGNVTTHSSQAYTSPDVMKTTYEYSSDGVYLTKVTDPMLLITTSTYNSFGQLASGKDPLGNTTTYEYIRKNNCLCLCRK